MLINIEEIAANPSMIPEVILLVITSIIGIFALSSGVEGYMFRNMKIWERILIIAGGFLMIYPGIVTGQ